METLNEIISLLRVVIIPLGVTFRVIFCLTKMIYDEDSQGTYKKKIKNTIVFGIIAELIFVILWIFNILSKIVSPLISVALSGILKLGYIIFGL